MYAKCENIKVYDGVVPTTKVHVATTSFHFGFGMEICSFIMGIEHDLPLTSILGTTTT
jgi:hypothetical protein